MRKKRRRSRGDAFCVALRAAIIAVTLLPEHALALELQFDEPASCATDEISFRVERALQRPLASVVGPDFRVGIEQDGTSFEGRVAVSGAEVGAERRFTAATCAELIDTLALTIVLAIGGGRADERPAPAELEVDAPVTPPRTAPESIADDSNPSPTPDERGAHLAPFASVVLDTGSLPALGVGPTLGVDIVWHAAELRLLATLLFAREGTADSASTTAAGADVGLMLGGALGCVPLATNAASLTIAVCAGVELGRMSAEGTNVDIARESTSFWVAPRVDAIARWSLPAPGLEVELQLEALAPLLRDEFVLRDIGSVHQPATLVGRAGFGIRGRSMKYPDLVDRQLALAWQGFTPPSGLRARVRARLGGLEPAGLNTPEHAATGAKMSGLRSLWASGKVGLGVGAGIFALGFFAGRLAPTAVSDPAPERDAPAQSEVASVPPSAPPAELLPAAVTEPPAAARSEPSTLPRSTAPRASARASSSNPSAASTGRDWRAELELLERAERALRAENVALALALLSEFDARYPRSSLREERQAIEVLAQCQAGSTDSAARAERFLRAHGQSVYAGRIGEMCTPKAPSSSAPRPLTNPSLRGHEAK